METPWSFLIPGNRPTASSIRSRVRYLVPSHFYCPPITSQWNARRLESIPTTTGMVKKVGPRLRELAAAARGGQDNILSWRYLWIKLCVDGEGKHARRCNKKVRDFTHPFIQKSTLLSTWAWGKSKLWQTGLRAIKLEGDKWINIFERRDNDDNEVSCFRPWIRILEADFWLFGYPGFGFGSSKKHNHNQRL